MSSPLDIEAGRQGHDRLGFTLAMALAFHAALILGVAFDFEPPKAGTQSSRLEITLAQYSQEKSPDEADYLAQHNQEASGTLDEKQKLTTTEQAELEASQINEIYQQAQLDQSQLSERPILTTSGKSSFSAFSRAEDEQTQEDEGQDSELTPKVAKEIASIEAELDKLRQDYAKKPKVKRLTSVATKASPEARYLFEWEQKIELMGNHYYPKEARAAKIYGDLRLQVTIYPNGSLDKVTILRSSGHDILDQAAIKIVKRSAPFKPLPAEIIKDADRLEIIRTWQFQRNFVTH